MGRKSKVLDELKSIRQKVVDLRETIEDEFPNESEDNISVVKGNLDLIYDDIFMAIDEIEKL